MSTLFSKRNKPLPTKLRYDLPDRVRKRVFAILRDLAEEATGDFDCVLAEVGKALFREYGELNVPDQYAGGGSRIRMLAHFDTCSTERALDFIEVCFQTQYYCGAQRAVEQINSVLREQGIGYELTPYVEHHVEKETPFFRRVQMGTLIEREFPRVIRRDDHFVHQEVIEPTLELLTNSKLRVANSEMLGALAALRSADYEGAITLCGSAFESVLKTICDLKKWPYDPAKDTCAKLVGICKDNGLFPPFYVPIFEAVGTVRNKLSSAHGRGPTPQHPVTKEYADHMVHTTSADILLLARLAGIG